MKSLIKSIAVASGCFALGMLACAFSDSFRVKVESKDGHKATRYIGNISSVRLKKRLSDKSCIQGVSWGYDGNRIWVDRGCRAEFEVRRRDSQPSTRQAYVTIESVDGKRKSRIIRYEGRVTLHRRLSSKPCVEGVSWGYGNSQIWVDRGCRAEFAYYKKR